MMDRLFAASLVFFIVLGVTFCSVYFPARAARADEARMIELVSSLFSYFEEESPPLRSFLDAVEAKHGRKVRKLVFRAITADLDKWYNEKTLDLTSKIP